MPDDIEIKNAEIVKPERAVAGELLSMQGEIDPKRLEEIANQRVEFFRKLALFSLKITSVHDWVDENGKPYLQTSGAKKLMKLWGIKITNPRMEMQMNLDTGKPYYKVWGQVSCKNFGIEIEILGGRDANDPFFANQANLSLLDVEKAAVSNFYNRAIKSVIGLDGLTWEEVAEMTQGRITKEKATGKVEYKKGAPSAQPASQPASGESPRELVELQKLLVLITSVDKDSTADAICKKYFVAAGGKALGYDEVRKFRTEKQLHWVHGACMAIRKDYANILPPEEPDAPKQPDLL